MVRGQCHNRSMCFFNTEGPVRPDKHYAIPPLDRVDIDEFLDLIRAERYFVLHAPRQTGKTSALIALRDLLNSGAAGNFRCVDVNVEVGRSGGARRHRARPPRHSGQLGRECAGAGRQLPPGSLAGHPCEGVGPDDALKRLLARWCCWWTRSTRWWATPCSRCCASFAPAYPRRTGGFPQSVVLCGVCDIRDYRIRSSTGAGPRRGRQPDVRGRPLVEEVGVRRPWLTRRSAGQMRLPEASAREVAVAAETKPSNCLTKQDHLRCC